MILIYRNKQTTTTTTTTTRYTQSLMSYQQIVQVEILGDQLMDEMGEVCNMHGRDEKYKILVLKPEQKRPHGRPRRRLWDNIKMDLREIG
jgi:hypothetical protein